MEREVTWLPQEQRLNGQGSELVYGRTRDSALQPYSWFPDFEARAAIRRQRYGREILSEAMDSLDYLAGKSARIARGRPELAPLMQEMIVGYAVGTGYNFGRYMGL